MRPARKTAAPQGRVGTMRGRRVALCCTVENPLSRSCSPNESRHPRHQSGPTRTGRGPPAPEDEAPFPVVGIGASAGGLEALTQLFQALPADLGMAFVLVSHLDPLHPSSLADILGRATRMPVREVSTAPRWSRTTST